MYKEKFIPKQKIELTSTKQIKAYIHPTRINIISLLMKEKRTISGIAKQFEVHPANITHHFKLLEKSCYIVILYIASPINPILMPKFR